MTHYQSVQAAEADVNIYVAEMRFFRALEYFNKIQLWEMCLGWKLT